MLASLALSLLQTERWKAAVELKGLLVRPVARGQLEDFWAPAFVELRVLEGVRGDWRAPLRVRYRWELAPVSSADEDGAIEAQLLQRGQDWQRNHRHFIEDDHALLPCSVEAVAQHKGVERLPAYVATSHVRQSQFHNVVATLLEISR